MDTPMEQHHTTSEQATRTAERWFATHCYHCGRTHESIEHDGFTPGCICDPGAQD